MLIFRFLIIMLMIMSFKSHSAVSDLLGTFRRMPFPRFINGRFYTQTLSPDVCKMSPITQVIAPALVNHPSSGLF